MLRRRPLKRGETVAAGWVLLTSTTFMAVGAIGDHVANDGRTYVSLWNVLTYVGLGVLFVGAVVVEVLRRTSRKRGR